jgi:hypothetical protein
MPALPRPTDMSEKYRQARPSANHRPAVLETRPHGGAQAKAISTLSPGALTGQVGCRFREVWLAPRGPLGAEPCDPKSGLRRGGIDADWKMVLPEVPTQIPPGARRNGTMVDFVRYTLVGVLLGKPIF